MYAGSKASLRAHVISQARQLLLFPRSACSEDSLLVLLPVSCSSLVYSGYPQHEQPCCWCAGSMSPVQARSRLLKAARLFSMSVRPCRPRPISYSAYSCIPCVRYSCFPPTQTIRTLTRSSSFYKPTLHPSTLRDHLAYLDEHQGGPLLVSLPLHGSLRETIRSAGCGPEVSSNFRQVESEWLRLSTKAWELLRAIRTATGELQIACDKLLGSQRARKQPNRKSTKQQPRYKLFTTCYPHTEPRLDQGKHFLLLLCWRYAHICMPA